MELQAQLDALAIDNVNEDGKGNSLFSEVNDRREKVETQLKVYEEKYELLKNNYDIKMAELQKTKMHNAKLLSIAGSNFSDSGHTARLEELLTLERNKNKTLRDRLDDLDKLTPAVVVPGPGQVMESDDTMVIPHTQSDEYSYLSTLLTNTQKSNGELKKQLQEQFRLSLEDSDKIREMTRKVNQLDSSMQKLKAENYTLKIHIDELKCKKGEQKIVKKEPKLIYEKLVFEKKNEPETSQKVNDEFVLKETIANNKPTTSNKSVQPTKDVNEKENVTVAAEKPKKKAACFAESVEKISTEGEKETSSLKANSPKEKVRPKKPEGKKKFGAANTVFVSDQDTAGECKQQ